MRRYELPERCWRRLDPLLPHPTHHHAGRPWADHHRVVHGILWRLHTGAQWRDLPDRYGPWRTVHARLARWRADGTWDRLATALLAELDRRGGVDRDLWCIDGTVARASRSAAGAAGGKQGPGRAGRPCPGGVPGRVRDQGPLGVHRPRAAPGGVPDPRPTAGV